MTEVYVPVSTLRQDLKNAQDRFDRAKTYDNALALQKAKQALENFFEAERAIFLCISNHGDIVVNPNHKPPATWRIIDGGKGKEILYP